MNKHLRQLALCVSLFCGVFFPSVHGMAEEVKVGVVDISKLVGPFMENIQKQVEDLLRTYHAEFSDIEKALRQENNEIVEAQKTLAATDKAKQKEWAQRKSDFDKRVENIRQDADKKKQRLGAAHETVVKRLQDIVLEVIQQVAEELDLSMIVPVQNLLYWKKGLNITEKAEQALQKRIADISLEVVTEIKND